MSVPRNVNAHGRNRVSPNPQPHTIHRANEAMVAVAQEDDHPILLVALPSGERWDVPLNAQAAGVILRGLAALTDGVEPD